MVKKIAIAVAVVLICAIGGAVFYLRTQLDPLVASAIETYGRQTTGTDVDVGGVSIALTEGVGKVGDLVIGNPDGFATDYFLRVQDAAVALDVGSLTSDVPVIRDILLDGAHLNAEQRGDATNLTEIQRNMTRSEAEPAPPQDQAPGRVIIDRFRLTNARVTITSDVLDAPEDLELADVVVERIGRTGAGATYDEATEAVLTPILAAVRNAFQQRLRDAAANAAREEIREEAKDKLESLLNRD